MRFSPSKFYSGADRGRPSMILALRRTVFLDDERVTRSGGGPAAGHLGKSGAKND
jgi:hypothetical protein